jgi:hypothetical protein
MLTSLSLTVFKRQFNRLRLEETKKQQKRIHDNYFRELSCDRAK